MDGCHAFPDQDMPRVSTEMSLHVLAYNLKRMMKIQGNKALIAMLKGQQAVA